MTKIVVNLEPVRKNNNEYLSFNLCRVQRNQVIFIL